MWDLNAAYKYGRYSLQGEFINADSGDIDRAYGFGIQGQMNIVDWLDCIPLLKNWSLWDAVNGVQLVCRYDQFDPNTNVDNAFDSRWYTIGWNLFIHDPYLKWQCNYTLREEMHGYEIDNNIFD